MNVETKNITIQRALRPREEIMEEYDHLLGYKFLVPKPYLFGTQDKAEYRPKSERWVRAQQQSKEGMFTILQNPEIVVAVKEPTGLRLFISDGHHRSRYCQRTEVPSLIYDEEYARSIANKFNAAHGFARLDTDEFKEHLYRSAESALHSFARSLPENKYPHLVRGVTSIPELKTVHGFKSY
ncbi:MAG: hypothetical protein KA035_00625 [Candidatus Levybacteria bacterium]|nr:hypothetical protein [Candidatus Levybacteria bacterium]